MSNKLVFPAPEPVTLPVSGTDLRFPVRRVYCVGRNYLAHIRELGNDERDPPFFFAKQRDMIVQDGGTCAYPSLTQDYQHEVELVVALKSGGADIPVEAALACVYGYAAGIDMTRRDQQNRMKSKQLPWEISKSFDQSAPCGPIRRAEETGPLTAGRISLQVNDRTAQDSDLAKMIWSVAEIVHHLSLQVALAPGDLIFTGTPEGVGPVARGDRLRAQIDQLEPVSVTIV